jgi:hypothetical protein
MSTSRNGSVPKGATAADCARLWTTLTTEYIPKLRLEIRMVTNDLGENWLSLEVVDDSLVTIDGGECVNIWASKEFRSELYLISVGQLFDLLITAYRKIDGFFSDGTPHAPTLRRK